MSFVWLMVGMSACVTSERIDDWEPPADPPSTDAHVCPDVRIDSEAAYEAARECTRIEGALQIGPDTPVARLAFPKLTAIAGDLAPIYGDYPHPLGALEFPALRSIGGSVTLSATSIAEVDWPKLRSIGGALRAISVPELVRFAAPKLEHIGGDMQITLAPKLERIDLRTLHRIDGFVAIFLANALREVRCENIEEVAGSASVDGLGLLSAEDILPLWEASDGSSELGQIGCCSDDPDLARANCGEFSKFGCSPAE